MSELQDLEAYEYIPPSVEDARQAAGRRIGKKSRLTMIENAAKSRRNSHGVGRRPGPSLPRFKCLED